ncbi:MAG: DUF3494 domain-containing protein [Bacteroidales bacterium]|nr:DUF3494 domain-containing protein [Bacteroidales bacterium]
MKKLRHLALTTMLCITIPAVNFGQIAPDLKSAADFAVLAGTGISFAAPMNEINDLDIGLYPGFLSSITGLENLTLNNGQVLAADQDPGNVLPQAKIDLRNAYLFAAASTVPAPATVSGNQGGSTLAPGIYKSTSTLSVDGTPLTLDAGGNENAVWIFQIASGLTTTVGGDIVLAGGAKANNVYWQVGSSATIGNDTDFKGNILALVSITMNTGSTLDGRALARNGAVTFAGGSTMNKPEESATVSGDLLITKTADPQTFSALNDQVDYDIVVENIGSVAVDNITVDDDLTSSSWLIASLDPGSSNTFTTSYNITAADLQNGFVANIATAEAVDILVSAYEVVTKEGLLITKVATPKKYSVIGQLIAYDIVLENNGGTTLENITVSDDLTGDDWIISLAPGQSQILQTSYSILEADMINGSVENIAIAVVGGMSISDTELVLLEEDPPAVPVSRWALFLTIGLISIFMIIFYRRL